MGRRIFNYRNGASYSPIAFFGLWSAACFAAMAFGSVGPEVMSGLLITGILTLLPAIALILRCLNVRIEVEGDEVRWFDILGRERGRGSVESAKFGDPFSSFDIPGVRVNTDGGQFKFGPLLNDFNVLKQLLAAGKEDVPARMPASTYVPPARVFRSLGSVPHLSSFLLMAAALWMGWSAIQDGGKNVDVAYIVLPPFLLAPLWMQIVSWNERILLGPDGIRWIDGYGRERVRAELDEIVEWEPDTGGEGQHLTIHTLKGTIAGLQFLGQAGKLHEEIRKLVDGRPKESKGEVVSLAARLHTGPASGDAT